jgi:hypothetical protein
MTRLFVAFVLCGMMMSAFAQDVKPKPDNLTLTVMRLADAEKQNQYVFVVTGVRPVAFKTLDGLKTYLRNRPKNSSLTWAPSDTTTTGEPLRSEEELKRFMDFCESVGTKFILIPAG